MALAQQYSDSLPEYPPECAPLQDLGFKIFPWIQVHWETQTWWENIADVWITASYVLFFVLLIFACYDSVIMATRFFWCMAYAFFMRALIVLATRYPRVPFKSTPNYHADNLVWGAILIMLGVRATSTDMMFSAHTCGWVMTMWFMWRYCRYLWVTILYWLINIAGIILLLCVREHYTADVLVAIFLATYVFFAYHLLLDEETHMIFGTVLILRFSSKKGGDAVLPLKIVDQRGHTIEPVHVPASQLARNDKVAFVRLGRNRSIFFSSVMRLLRWLDK